MDNNKIWFFDINLLFNKENLFNIVPTSDMSNGQKINSITRFSLYLSILLYLISGNYLYLYIFLGTIIITYLVYIFNEKEFFRNDGYDNIDNIDDLDDETISNEDNIGKKDCKKPTQDNPLMNPIIGENPYKNKGACNIENNKILEKIDKKFCDRLFQDTSTIFNNRANQRSFYTVPNTGPVNDQTGFANWLYKTPVSCDLGEDMLLKQVRNCDN